MYFSRVEDWDTSITEIVSFFCTKSWNPSKPIMEAYDFWVKGGKLPVFIEIIPLDEKAKLSYKSEFHEKLFIFTYWNSWVWVIKSYPTRFLYKSKTASFFFVTLISHFTTADDALYNKIGKLLSMNTLRTCPFDNPTKKCYLFAGPPTVFRYVTLSSKIHYL